MVLTALRQRVRLGSVTPCPGAGVGQDLCHRDVVLRHPGVGPRVAVDDPPVEGHEVQVHALQAHVDAPAAVGQQRGDRADRVDHAGDPVVDDLPGRAADDDAAFPQGVPPLVVGEVVQGAATAEVQRRQRGRPRLRDRRRVPPRPTARIHQWGHEVTAGDDDLRHVDAEQPADHRDRVVQVRGGHLDRGRLPDDALADQGEAGGVAGHQQVLLGDLDTAGRADVGPQRAQPVQVRCRWRLG